MVLWGLPLQKVGTKAGLHSSLLLFDAPLFPMSPLLSKKGHHLPWGQGEPIGSILPEGLEPRAGSLGSW